MSEEFDEPEHEDGCRCLPCHDLREQGLREVFGLQGCTNCFTTETGARYICAPCEATLDWLERFLGYA